MSGDQSFRVLLCSILDYGLSLFLLAASLLLLARPGGFGHRFGLGLGLGAARGCRELFLGAVALWRGRPFGDLSKERPWRGPAIVIQVKGRLCDLYSPSSWGTFWGPIEIFLMASSSLAPSPLRREGDSSSSILKVGLEASGSGGDAM